MEPSKKRRVPLAPKFKIGDTITDGTKTIVFTNYNKREKWYMGYIPGTSGLMITLQESDKLSKV